MKCLADWLEEGCGDGSSFVASVQRDGKGGFILQQWAMDRSVGVGKQFYVAHPEQDAPKEPYETLLDSEGWFVRDRRKLGRMVFSGTELQCNDVRDVLNRGETR